MADVEMRRELPEDDIERMIRAVEPEWGLRDATFMEDGVTSIYRVTVATGTGDRECFLKATPSPERPFGLDTEARLTEVVRTHTDIPAPRVIGAVDEHETLRAPFFLMESMDGTVHPMSVMSEMSERALRSLARETGRYVGQLHDIRAPNVTRFGKGLSHESDTTLRGGRPPGDPAELAFPDGYERWRDRLREWIEGDLEKLGETDRFADLVDPIEASLAAMVEDLPGSPTPVLGRIDQGLWNLLTDESRSELTAMLDWGSLFVVPPAYDLAVMEFYLAGGVWIGLEDVPDHRAAIREAMLRGYREERAIPDVYERRRRCYQLDTVVLALVSIETAPESTRMVPTDRIDEAAAGMREVVDGLL